MCYLENESSMQVGNTIKVLKGKKKKIWSTNFLSLSFQTDIRTDNILLRFSDFTVNLTFLRHSYSDLWYFSVISIVFFYFIQHTPTF